MTVQLIAEQHYDASDLMSQYPPRFSDPRKQRIFQSITVPVSGELRVSRWSGDISRVGRFNMLQLSLEKAVLPYPPPVEGVKLWHMNFADSALFGFYGSALLAQDEHQVLEHPVLGSVREALVSEGSLAGGLLPRTRDRGLATPVLIEGAQRSLFFDTVTGPYGNAFSYASDELLRASTTLLDTPTFSNIVAIEAPKLGAGTYKREEIRDALESAYIGFKACRERSGGSELRVFTGNWGCGAFGGNPTLMSLLQFVAASLAGVDSLVFHSRAADAPAVFLTARELFDSARSAGQFDLAEFLNTVHTGFKWGQSDGN